MFGKKKKREIYVFCKESLGSDAKFIQACQTPFGSMDMAEAYMMTINPERMPFIHERELLTATEADARRRKPTNDWPVGNDMTDLMAGALIGADMAQMVEGRLHMKVTMLSFDPIKGQLRATVGTGSTSSEIIICDIERIEGCNTIAHVDVEPCALFPVTLR